MSTRNAENLSNVCWNNTRTSYYLGTLNSPRLPIVVADNGAPPFVGQMIKLPRRKQYFQIRLFRTRVRWWPLWISGQMSKTSEKMWSVEPFGMKMRDHNFLQFELVRSLQSSPKRTYNLQRMSQITQAIQDARAYRNVELRQNSFQVRSKCLRLLDPSWRERWISHFGFVETSLLANVVLSFSVTNKTNHFFPSFASAIFAARLQQSLLLLTQGTRPTPARCIEINPLHCITRTNFSILTPRLVPWAFWTKRHFVAGRPLDCCNQILTPHVEEWIRVEQLKKTRESQRHWSLGTSSRHPEHHNKSEQFQKTPGQTVFLRWLTSDK